MSRRWTTASLSLLAALLLSAPAAAQRGEPAWKTLGTRHYEIRYSCSPIEAKYLGDWMEFVHGAYSQLIKVQSADKHVIKLFKDRKEWIAYRQPAGAGAYYTLQTKQLVGYYDSRAVFPFFAHEGTHQFIHIAVPEMERLIPTWFNEGLADCMGSSKVIKGQFRWCLFNALIAQGRTYTIKKALREGKAKALKDLFALDHVQFMQDPGLHYAQSWSFVHFLFCCPHVELPHKVIPNGDYKQAVVVYFERLRQGDGHEKAWAQALEAVKKTHEELEAAWKEYVLGALPETGPQDDDAYLGVQTEESKAGGMDVLAVVEGGPAEEAGIRKGDRLLSLGSAKLKTREAFAEEMKKRKPGDEIEVSILRDNKKLTLKVTLGRRGDYDKEAPKEEPKDVPKEEPKEEPKEKEKG